MRRATSDAKAPPVRRAPEKSEGRAAGHVGPALRESAGPQATTSATQQHVMSCNPPLQHNAKQKGAARDERSLAAPLRVLWRCPTLPQPVGCSTIGAAGLSFQVRNGGWAFPRCYDHHKTGCSTLLPRTWLWGCGLIVVCIVVAAVCSRFFVHPLCWVIV